MQATVIHPNPKSARPSALISAVACGALCGPAAIGLALFAEHLDPSGLDTRIRQCLGLLAIVALGSTIVFGWAVRARLADSPSPQNRMWANVAVCSSASWTAILVAYMVFVISVV